MIIEFETTLSDNETEVFVSANVEPEVKATFNDDGYPGEVEIQSVFAGEVEIDIKTLSKEDKDKLEYAAIKAYDSKQ